MDRRLQRLATAQRGVVTRQQLEMLGLTRSHVRAQLDAERWSVVTSTVIALTTGELSREQRVWAAVLHAGGHAILGGLSAVSMYGLKNWDRDEVCVYVPYSEDVPRPMVGVSFVRTRRDLGLLRTDSYGVPRCRLEPAALMFASTAPSPRTAEGILAAVVQQRLTEPERLLAWIDQLPRLRRAPRLRNALAEIAGGAQSVAELDVARLCKRHGLVRPGRQTKRRDADGRWRFTDCEWRLVDGRTLVLEVDGAFHMSAESWEDDLTRQWDLAASRRVTVRCSARQVRDEGDQIAWRLQRSGVPRVA